MRIVMALALLVGMATPAIAGQRIVYLDLVRSKQLVIEVADNGDVRIGEPGSEDFGLLLGDDFYIVDAEGNRATVARLRDVAAAIDVALSPIFGNMLEKGGSMPDPGLKIVPGEATEFGGHQGRIYRISGFDGAASDRVSEYVISADPALSRAGRALQGFMDAGMVPGAPLVGRAIRRLIAQTHAIFALGTPIDIGGRLRLGQISKAELPGFRLPVGAQTVDMLVASMKLSMQTPAPPPTK